MKVNRASLLNFVTKRLSLSASITWNNDHEVHAPLFSCALLDNKCAICSADDLSLKN